MWTPLDKITEPEFRHLATLATLASAPAETPEYAELIRPISSRPYAGEVAVVTALYDLSLSGQLQWEAPDPLGPHHLHPPGMSIRLEPGQVIRICYHPGCADTGDPPEPT